MLSVGNDSTLTAQLFGLTSCFFERHINEQELPCFVGVHSDEVDHGPRLRACKPSLGKLEVVTFSDMPTRKPAEPKATKAKAEPKPTKTYTLDQQKVMAALGIKPE